MPRNGSGQYSPPTGTFGISGTPISSSAYDTFINDLSTELTNSLNVQGTAPMLADLNMGTFNVINAADPIAATDLATKEYVDTIVPAGVIIAYPPFAGGLVPTGYLACNGATLDTTTYANLFAVLGYTYGGAGASFNLPDFRGCFLRGGDYGRGLDFQGSRLGNSYQSSYLVNHDHAIIDNGHTHGVSDPTHFHGATTDSHNHSASDAGHAHGPGGLANFVGSGGSLGVANSPFNLATGDTAVGFANISISTVGNIGVNVFGALTGIGIFGALTGVAVGSVSTGNVNFAYPETTVQNYPVLWCIKY